MEEITTAKKMSQEQAFAWFDRLAPVRPEELTGIWRGTEIATGHPMDGLLGAIGWFGKEIRSQEEVHPLLFAGNRGKTFSGNPGLMPLTALISAPRLLIKMLFAVASPFIHTKKGRGRLCIREYRGKNTTVMQYDQKPILDAFVRIDDHSILGVSDMKWTRQTGYFFTLTKVSMD